jgi:hypothetical protein
MTKLPPGIPNASITIWSFLVLLLLFVILSVHLTVYLFILIIRIPVVFFAFHWLPNLCHVG